MPDFQFLRPIRDHRSAVHFAARTHHRKHAAYGQHRAIGLFKTQIILIPWIFFAIHGNGYRLRVIANGTAAHGKDKIGLSLSCAGNPFV